jgi:hypothetical protein
LGKAGVCRAPIAVADSRSNYEFWNGSTWVKDINATASILNVIPGSVSFSPHFKVLMNVYSEIGSNTAYVRFANNPEGPWSAKQVLYNTPPLPEANKYNYIINEHAELAKNNGKTIFISYSHPLPWFRGDVRLAQVDFK